MINLSNKQYSYLLDRSYKVEELQSENIELKGQILDYEMSINRLKEESESRRMEMMRLDMQLWLADIMQIIEPDKETKAEWFFAQMIGAQMKGASDK